MFLVEMSVGLGGGSASLQADALDFPGVTASISFANPAVTVARSLSDTFSGIVPAGVVRIMELEEQGWSYVRP